MRQLQKLGGAIALLIFASYTAKTAWSIPLNLSRDLASFSIQQNNQDEEQNQTQDQDQDQDQGEIDFSSTGRPNNRTGLGSRGFCNKDGQNNQQNNMTVLVPETVEATQTISDYPTFWLYLSDRAEDIESVELVLRDVTSQPAQEIYRQEYTFNGTPGIVGLTVEKTKMRPLEVGKTYLWFVNLSCRENVNVTAKGELQRVAIQSPKSDYNFYIQNRLWFEAVTELALGLRLNPLDAKLKEQWQQLLGAKGVNFQNLADIPIVDCCTLKAN